MGKLAIDRNNLKMAAVQERIVTRPQLLKMKAHLEAQLADIDDSLGLMDARPEIPDPQPEPVEEVTPTK